MIKLLVSIFGQITGYRIYTVSREPIRLPKINIQLLVFNKNKYVVETLTVFSSTVIVFSTCILDKAILM